MAATAAATAAIQIDGRITSDFGVAGTNFKLQWPELEKHFPEIAGSHPGTINVQLDQALLVLNPDGAVPPFEWRPGLWEGFCFLRATFEFPLGGEQHRAWLFLPHRSFNRFNLHRAEVITKYLPGVARDAPCRIHFPRATGYVV
jgi:hypothetical protein